MSISTVDFTHFIKYHCSEGLIISKCMLDVKKKKRWIRKCHLIFITRNIRRHFYCFYIIYFLHIVRHKNLSCIVTSSMLASVVFSVAFMFTVHIDLIRSLLLSPRNRQGRWGGFTYTGGERKGWDLTICRIYWPIIWPLDEKR